MCPALDYEGMSSIDIVNKEVVPSSYSGNLRISLIGNKDLKFKLINNAQFIEELVDDFTQQINLILDVFSKESFAEVGISPDKLDLLEHLENRTVILSILYSSVSEVNTSRRKDVIESLYHFERSIRPCVSFILFYTEKVAPHICHEEHKSAEVIKIEKIAEYCIDLIISVLENNIYGDFFDHTIVSDLWKSIVTIVVFSDLEELLFKGVLLRILKLVPLILSNLQISDTNIRTLLSVLIHKLSQQCDIVCTLYYPNFESLKLTDNRLTKVLSTSAVTPSNYYLHEKLDIAVLNRIMICTAQLLNFSKEFDYDVLGFNPLLDNSNRKPEKVISNKIYVAMIKILNSDASCLKLSALNLVSLYLGNLSTDNDIEEEKSIFGSYKEIFPRIVDILNSEGAKGDLATLPAYLMLPIKVLSNIYTKYPLINDSIRKTKLDQKVITSLEIKFKDNKQLNFLRFLKKELQYSKKIGDFTELLNIHDHYDSIGDTLLFLSVFTSVSEENRTRVADFKNSQGVSVLSKILFEIVENYNFLLHQFQLIYRLLFSKEASVKLSKEQLPWLGKNLGVIVSLLDSPINTNCFYLMRSLSRSVSTLRTFFVECNSLPSFLTAEVEATSKRRKRAAGSLIANFLEILTSLEVCIGLIDYFKNFTTSRYNFKRNQMLNKSITLGVLANLVLDFSSFRYEIINEEHFLGDLLTMYKNSADLSNNLDKLDHEDVYQRNIIQLNILQLLKNLMFNENNESKKEMIEIFSLPLLLDKTSYGMTKLNISKDLHSIKLQQKLVAFDILRNFTAGTPDFNAILETAFENEYTKQANISTNWADYIVANIIDLSVFNKEHKYNSFDDDFCLLSSILDDNYVKLVTAINYIEDHKFTNYEEVERKLFPDDKLLRIWLRLLSLTAPTEFYSKLDISKRVSFNNNLNEIKISIVWVLLNLTWDENSVLYQLPESSRFEFFDTIEENTRRSSTMERIDLDDSDDTEGSDEEHSDDDATGSQSKIGVLERAKYLKKFGFTDTLFNLIKDLSKQPLDAKNSNDSSTKRFDLENSNDLLEKVKTAHNQIAMLVKRTRRSKFPPVYQVSNVNKKKSLPRDLNRGGEGFGYGSDEEYLQVENDDPELHQHASTERPSTSHDRPTENDADDYDDLWIR